MIKTNITNPGFRPHFRPNKAETANTKLAKNKFTLKLCQPASNFQIFNLFEPPTSTLPTFKINSYYQHQNHLTDCELLKPRLTVMAPLPVADNRQRQPLTVALKNICRDYPAGGGVLRELLQNADDAGATVVVSTLHAIYFVDRS